MGTELELKYHLEDAAQSESVLSWQLLPALRIGEPYAFAMKTTYFDTPDGLFSARHWTVRRRIENERSIFCVKTPHAGTANGKLRDEWEIEAVSFSEAAQKLVALGAPAELAVLSEDSLVPICGAQFTRRAQLLRLSKQTVCELACDAGELLGKTQSLPFFELELELKEGSAQDLNAFGQMLAVCFGLSVEPKSKFARARSLT